MLRRGAACRTVFVPACLVWVRLHEMRERVHEWIPVSNFGAQNKIRIVDNINK
jgi:hypothetical protein